MIEKRPTMIDTFEQEPDEHREVCIFFPRRKSLDVVDLLSEVSFDDHDHAAHHRPASADDEHLTPGSYLLPVADVDFAIRMRGYRRTTYANRYASSDYLYKPPVASAERLLARDTVKERLHVDAQGRRVRGCSAVPHSGCSASRELSYQPGSTRGISSTPSFYAPYGRTSESPAHGYGLSAKYGSSSRLSPFPSSTPARAPSIPREFQAQGFTQEQRNSRGEGSQRVQTSLSHLSLNLSSGFAAVFKEKLTDTSFLIGGTVILRCKVQGNPFPRVFWYRNDEFIIEDDRIQFAQGEDGLCTLTITHCKASDIGIYRCVARNVYGDASCKARLLIGGKDLHERRISSLDLSFSQMFPIDLNVRSLLIFRRTKRISSGVRRCTTETTRSTDSVSITKRAKT